MKSVTKNDDDDSECNCDGNDDVNDYFVNVNAFSYWWVIEMSMGYWVWQYQRCKLGMTMIDN